MLKIITSGALAAALEKILPIFSKEYDISYSLSYGSSFGEAHDSIPSRIKNGENFDFYFLAEGALLKHAKEGIVDINSKVNLISSSIGIAVKDGGRSFKIDTLSSFKQALIDANSIAYAASASGIYLSETVFLSLFPENGSIKAKSIKILSERVGNVLVRGEAEIGFQQLSELMPIKGLSIIGKLPIEIRKSFIFSCAIGNNTLHIKEYDQFLGFIKQEEIVKIINNTGVEIL